MLRLLATSFKIILACLLAGAILSFFGITTVTLMTRLGLTAADLWTYWDRAVAWAVPNIVLGAMVVLPVWALTYLFMPPRNG